MTFAFAEIVGRLTLQLETKKPLRTAAVWKKLLKSNRSGKINTQEVREQKVKQGEAYFIDNSYVYLSY